MSSSPDPTTIENPPSSPSGRGGGFSRSRPFGSGLYDLALEKPGAMLAAVLTALVLLAVQAHRLELEASIDFLSTQDPVAAADGRRLAVFGNDFRLIVGFFRSAEDGGVVDRGSLEALMELHRTLEAEPGIAAVSSLANAPIFVPPKAPAGTAVVGAPLLDAAVLAEPDLLRRRLRAAPFQKALLLSPRESLAPLFLGLDPEADEVVLSRRVLSLARDFEEHSDGRWRVLVSGPALVETALSRHVLGDLGRLVPFTALLIAMGLGLYLRRPVFLAVIVVHILALEAVVLGAMGALGWRIDLVSVLAPVVALPVGIADLLHLGVRLRGVRLHAAPAAGSYWSIDRLRRAFDRLRLPMLATTVTTSVGFLGFLLSPVAAIRQLGAVLALAAIAALLLTFTLDAALLALFWRPVARPAGRGRRRASAFERWIVGLARSPRRRLWQARAAVSIFLLAGLIGIAALPELGIDDTWLQNFDPHSRIRLDTERFESELIGTNAISVVFEVVPAVRGSGAADARQRLLDTVDRFTRVHLATTGSRGVLSPTLLARSLDPDQGFVWQSWPTPTPEAMAEAVTAWQRRGLSRPSMATFTDPHLERMQVQIYVLQLPYAQLEEQVTRIEGLARGMAGPGVRATVSGDLATNVRMVRQAVLGQARSLLLLLALVMLLLSAYARSWRLGLLLILPMALSILLSYAVVVAAEVPYGIAVSMFPTLVVGLSVDFAIHLWAAWVGRAGTCHPGSSVSRVRRLAIILRGILLNGVLWSAGFALLGFSALPPNRYLGLLAATVIGASTLFTVFLVPLLLGRGLAGDTDRRLP